MVHSSRRLVFFLWAACLGILCLVAGNAFGQRSNKAECDSLWQIYEAWGQHIDISPRENFIFPAVVNDSGFYLNETPVIARSKVVAYRRSDLYGIFDQLAAEYTQATTREIGYNFWTIVDDLDVIDVQQKRLPPTRDLFEFQRFSMIAVDDAIKVLVFLNSDRVAAKYFIILNDNIDALPLLGSMAAILGYVQERDQQVRLSQMFSSYWRHAKETCPDWLLNPLPVKIPNSRAQQSG